MTYFPHDVLDVIEPEEPSAQQLSAAVTSLPEYAFRRSMGAIEIALAAAAAVGVVQLGAGIATPPDSQLPFGLDSWAWPAVWLFATVCVPSVVAAVALSRRARSGPSLVIVATVLLAIELLVQIPFVGLNWLQLVVALVGATAATMAVVARTTKE